ncbi:hypothetical protein K470DRAFT_211372 [Piedraia hortae CBS 480.64]|uniref:Zn(2)-C6 fungal-type domain-containing protein n=1 Tax=Piedraia hortae CBS 480.64 TaxID=1314780 RepID=A0A6A7C913_9PEZI|nr:hypothetical protein K470DRAFT_211372 [Piedraia hortae CBS 480.64]
MSPDKRDQKHVVFKLIDPSDPRYQARLPMRVMISPNDRTDSIITTVKNFYGLYDYGVSFENTDGMGIIAAYDNFEHDMTVLVRTVTPPPVSVPPSAPRHDARHSSQSSGARLGAPLDLRSSLAQDEWAHPPHDAPRDELGSTGNHADGSSTGGRRGRADHVIADISVDNIVEGGRRRRAFESSELPLFIPPQAPTTMSMSSVSPRGRTHADATSPVAPYLVGGHTHHVLPSPHSHSDAQRRFHAGPTLPPLNATTTPSQRTVTGTYPHPADVLPTPDPTVRSVISDEDVALQLMRLGDPGGYSHGRTSTSTIEDEFSGTTEAVSPCASDSEGQGHKIKKQRVVHRHSSNSTTTGDAWSRSTGKSTKIGTKRGAPSRIPMSPASLPGTSRKGSSASALNFQHQPLADEEDLSSKPRCQRCRKSKKGCDRQRPCGRCRDAGIGIEGCISEDEGNGRKGRYGRHMGVPIKKESEVFGERQTQQVLAPAQTDKRKRKK